MGPNQIAIILAALIVGASIIGARFVGRYEIAPSVGADGNPFVWRLDTRTGEVESCAFYKNPFDQFDPDNKSPSKPSIQCSKVFKP